METRKKEMILGASWLGWRARCEVGVLGGD